MPISMMRRVAFVAWLVIVHILLIHMLHFVTSPEMGSSPHHSMGESSAMHGSVSESSMTTDDVDCSAPTFVMQRFEVPVADAFMGIGRAFTSDVEQPSTLPLPDCILPRPPGPERQAILQRFTL